MKEILLSNSSDGHKASNQIGIQINDQTVDSDYLPPIEMKTYAFSPNQLYRKKKSVQNAIQEAESQIASELGRTGFKKKKTFRRRAIRWIR